MRQEHILTVFVASPDDVKDERNKLEEVIRELNITWSKELGIRLDLVRWETHAYPDIGNDAQDVINKQISDEYDLFIGIMWCRFGAPTSRFGSGTAEEFERARARYIKNPSRINIMFYFKDEPISPSKVDPDQLIEVNKFMNSIGDEGVLFWKFSGLDQFEKYARIHLSRQVQEWKKGLQGQQNEQIIDKNDNDIDLHEESDGRDEFGILDLMEIFEERFHEVTRSTRQIEEATKEFGIKIDQHANDIDKLPKDINGRVEYKGAKRIIAKAAIDMGSYAARIEAELPLFKDALNVGLDAIIQSLSMSAEFDLDKVGPNEAAETLNAIVELQDTFIYVKGNMLNFLQTTVGIPPMTGELKRQKRVLSIVLKKLIAEFDNGYKLLDEIKIIVNSSEEKKVNLT